MEVSKVRVLFGLVWFGLVWFGLVWFSLVGLFQIHESEKENENTNKHSCPD